MHDAVILFSNPLLPSAVTKAEILIAMLSVMSHFTHNSCNDFPALFKLMFPDCEIASKILLGRTKLGYVVNYGLAPYFRGKISKGKDKNYLSCKLCGGSSLRLGNMVMGALKKHDILNTRKMLQMSSLKSIFFTANKVSESCGSSDFTKSPNLAEPTSPTVQKQLFSNPLLPSAVTKAEILFAMQ